MRRCQASVKAEAGQGGNRVAGGRGGCPALFPGPCGRPRCSRAIGLTGTVRWWTRAGTWWHRRGQAGCVGGAGGHRVALPENVNYAVKSSLLLSFLESVPDVAARLKEPLTADRKFEDVVKSAQEAAVLLLVY